MPVRSKILIAHNPKAGAANRKVLLEQLAKRLKNTGFEVLVSADLAETEQLARDLHEQKTLHTVVSAGGDGTVSAVAQRVGPGTSIAVFPLGTENLLGKWLGATTDVPAFCRALQAGKTWQMDAASVNGRLALITVGVGFDAEVVRQVHQNRRGHITKWNYLAPIWRTFWNYQFPRLEIEATEWTATPLKTLAQEPKVWLAPWLFIANLPNYAGGMKILPLADPSDGMLDIATFAQGGRLQGLMYALKIASHKHQHCRDFFALRAKRIVVRGPESIGYQIDGDFGGYLPLEIVILPKRVQLLQFRPF